MKLVDTDIAIDHFHGHQAARDYFAETFSEGEVLAISVVTLTGLMAACAALNQAELITRNTKHYPMTDIQVVSPYARGRV